VAGTDAHFAPTLNYTGSVGQWSAGKRCAENRMDLRHGYFQGKHHAIVPKNVRALRLAGQRRKLTEPAVINNALDINLYRQRLVQNTRVQIPGFLQEEAAEAIHRCLAEEIPWALAERSGGESHTIAAEAYAAMSEQDRQALLVKAYARAKSEFQFSYDSYMMVRAVKEGWTRNLLHDVLEFLNAPEFLQFARRLTGEPTIDRVSAQATRYRPGQFLTRHQDEDVSEGRVCAYVINLSRNWDSDWGGLLQFHDADRRLIDSFVPYWNHLSLFRVPQSHTVSLVSPWAGSDRLAVTGWFLAK
jgi:Rps23 Pro-64 3,4-dihydroxylase Tpa1-like proline 4-hydroxylase